MKRRTLIVLGAISLAGASLSYAPIAQAGDCCRGHHGCPMAGAPAARPGGGGPATGPMYDPDTVTTLRGAASAVTVVPARAGLTGGMHFTLQTEGQTMDVHLGPTWFLQREGVEIAKGDSVEVTGSVIDSDGKSFLIARDLKKGQKVLKLRDEQGFPAWAGGRRP